MKGTHDEAVEFHRRADHWGAMQTRGGRHGEFARKHGASRDIAKVGGDAMLDKVALKDR